MFEQEQLDSFFVLWMELRLLKQRDSIAQNIDGTHMDDRMLEIYDMKVSVLTCHAAVNSAMEMGNGTRCSLLVCVAGPGNEALPSERAENVVEFILMVT